MKYENLLCKNHRDSRASFSSDVSFRSDVLILRENIVILSL